MIRSIIAGITIALTAVIHFFQSNWSFLLTFITIIVWILTLGSVAYKSLAKSIGHPAAIGATLFVLGAAAIASWPSIIQTVNSLYVTLTATPKSSNEEQKSADPPKQLEPPSNIAPDKSKDHIEVKGEQNTPNDVATTEIRQRYLKLKDSKIWFFKNGWFPIIENGHFLLYFSCTETRLITDSRWYIYTYDANVTDRWYLIEHYSDGSTSDAIIPATRDARYKVEDKIDWFIPFMTNLLFKIVRAPSVYIRGIDLIDSRMQYRYAKSGAGYLISSVNFDTQTIQNIRNCTRTKTPIILPNTVNP